MVEQDEEKRCDFIDGCPMFKRFNDKKALEIWKVNYCQGDYQRCARFKKRKAGEPIEDKLLPSGDMLRFA